MTTLEKDKTYPMRARPEVDSSLDDIALETLERSRKLEEQSREKMPGVSKMKRGSLQELVLRLGQERDAVTLKLDTAREEIARLKNEAILAKTEIAEVKAREEKALKNAEKAHFEATHDPLTDLFNRRGVYEELEPHFMFLAKRFEQIRKAAREVKEPHPMSVLMLDIDHFKSFNDRFGHETGDTVLRMVSDVIRNELRGVDDLAIRWGGEEFMVILPNIQPMAGLSVAERIRRSVERLNVTVGDETVPITITVGVTDWHGGEDLARRVDGTADRGERRKHIAKALKEDADHADKALYIAKRKRNFVWKFGGIEGVEEPAPPPADTNT